MTVFITNLFECREFEDGEYIGKEDAELAIDDQQGEIYFDLRSRDVGAPDTRENRSVTGQITIHNLERAYLKRITNIIEQWLESDTRSSVTVEIGEVDGTCGRHGEREKFDLLSVGIDERGIWFLADGGDTESVRSPAATKQIDGEYNNIYNIIQMKEMIEEFLYTYGREEKKSSVSDTGVLTMALSDVDEELQDRSIPKFDRGEYVEAAKEAGQLLEERVRDVAPDVSNSDHGKSLMTTVFNPQNGSLSFGEIPGEKQGVLHLYTGAIQGIWNPLHHRTPDPSNDRYLDSLDRQQAHDIICYINFLLRILEDNK